jgi:hypothetical protein
MQKGERATAMILFVCEECDVSATCVANDTALLAWSDHMANHERPDRYRCYTWTAVQLPLE